MCMKMKKGNKWMPNRKSSEATSRNHSVPSALFPNYLSSNFFSLSTFRELSSWSLLFSSGHFSSAWFTLIQFSTLGNDSHSWQKTPIYCLPACVCPCVFVGCFGKRQHLLHLSYSPDVTPSASPTRRQRNRIVACCQQQIGLRSV